MPDLRDGAWLLVVAPFITIPIFTKLGLYRAIIRFLGHKAIIAVSQGVAFSACGLILITYLFKLQGVPKSVFAIYLGTAFLLVSSSRHFIRRYYQYFNHKDQRIPVVIYGAGSSGSQLAQALFNSPEYEPLAFIDDDKSLQGSYIHSLKIYSFEQLQQLIDNTGIKQILLALPSATQQRRREIVQLLEPYPIHVRSIPGMADLVSGQKSIEEIREIEIDELLGRPSVNPQSELLELCIKNKNILVTGAGGSIGSELCRQIIQLEPQKLILFELSEVSLYLIEKELSEHLTKQSSAIELIALLGSVQNQDYLYQILTTHQIHTLYHAAAYKHVPLVEFNPIEGIKNNAIGTWCAANAAYKAGIDHFVLISTDKAVRPTNVMGATKRIAELVLQGFAQKGSKSRFAMVRFGNVLGSSGSVVPLFRRQIKAGGPITVTHPDIIRYFMTIPEAAQLVIQAGAMAEGGEVFLLDMGEPVKIVDLAKRMIRLSGLAIKDDQHPEGNIAIQFTGLRPGEKLYEELLIENNANPTQHPRIFKANEDCLTWSELETTIQMIIRATDQYDINTIYQILETYVQGYKKPNEQPLIVAQAA
ncbi:polysaccharide biosynthesis protein [Thiolinea disciformis]|uniref:polysaccharide biosynthesis protein n=1 Tax=Thiolinea disciformis TaxID=125614 RepID=UPI001B7F965F|nr:nucleoside-diphosphate sugar epimerase/dehydratase [Thiolinea disciformis]